MTDKKQNKNKIFEWEFSRIYPMYVDKAEKKGRTKAEVDEIIEWLFGYNKKQLASALSEGVTLEDFVSSKAPKPNPNRNLITGVVCGIRVENVEDPTTREMRYLDKLIDELAKGKAMEKVLRTAKD